jgi:hypothetical protein
VRTDGSSVFSKAGRPFTTTTIGLEKSKASADSSSVKASTPLVEVGEIERVGNARRRKSSEGRPDVCPHGRASG